MLRTRGNRRHLPLGFAGLGHCPVLGEPIPPGYVGYPDMPGMTYGPYDIPGCFQLSTGYGNPPWYGPAFAKAAADGYSFLATQEQGGTMIYVNPNGSAGRLGTDWNKSWPILNPSDYKFVSPPKDVWESIVIANGGTAVLDAYNALVAQQTLQAQQNAAAATASGVTGQLPSSYVAPAAQPAVTVLPPATQTTYYTPRVSFTNSRGGTHLQPGDNWTIQITGGRPNSPVTSSALRDGASLGTSPFGSTDAQGNFTLQGQIDNSSSGAWQETWFVGSDTAGSFSFDVGAGSSPPYIPPGSTSITQTPAASIFGQQYPAAPPASAQSTAGLLGIGSIPTTYLIGGGVLLLVLLMGGRR